MVIKTDVCSFAEFRLYPGHGIRFVRKDGQLLTFSTRKARSLYDQKKKPARLTWTMAWRRKNKKENRDETKRKKRRKVQKVLRPVVGVSVEALKKRRNERPEQREAARAAALKEVKDRQKKKAGKK